MRARPIVQSCLLLFVTACSDGPQDLTPLSMTVRWQAPAQFINGQPIHLNEIEAYVLSWQDADDVLLGSAEIPTSQTAYQINGLYAGSYRIALSSKSIYGGVSEPVYFEQELVVSAE